MGQVGHYVILLGHLRRVRQGPGAQCLPGLSDLAPGLQARRANEIWLERRFSTPQTKQGRDGVSLWAKILTQLHRGSMRVLAQFSMIGRQRLSRCWS